MRSLSLRNKYVNVTPNVVGLVPTDESGLRRRSKRRKVRVFVHSELSQDNNLEKEKENYVTHT